LIAVELETVYLKMVSEAASRLSAAEAFLSASGQDTQVYRVESAVLQVRKALEAAAFAAVAPNQAQYEAFRANAQEPADYRKDYNARAIFKYLEKINKDFYPIPLLPPKKQADGTWHFERRPDGYLTKKNFESFYDRLGKYLHADNPWGSDKGLNNLLVEVPRVIGQVRALLEWHTTVIRTPAFNGVWVAEVPVNGRPCRILLGKAEGEFVVH
jgi:hypothetical protein